ncbi:AraC family transcriptional regulator [Bosea caraganae]|uniref:AraC family transcriptional regulator n=2 Tax=Bosea caraganae TaxID=2763117 RepID=A0A370KXU3_9HYPH|nr:AraC family transcriptional regulator [Bosea caraganae]RDJ30041.1 AraC family transcriptional regulator [Bosea caraganae]
MSFDDQLDITSSHKSFLLRNQLYTLIARLAIAHSCADDTAEHSPCHLNRFNRFRQAVEKDFRKLHKIGEYARILGYSEKTLTRSILSSAGVSPKSFLSQRIVLEAKRLLIHTTQTVSAIAHQIGFDEPSNFIKFFKRETGCAPTEFRRLNSGLEIR